MTETTNPPDLRLRGQEATSNAWQEMAVSPSFVFDGLGLLDASGVELAWSTGNGWLLDDGRRMLALSFEANRGLVLKAAARSDELLLNADGPIHVNGRSLVIAGRTVLVLDGRGRWNHPSNSRRRFRLLTIE
jgi:hypothetical protein